MKITINIDSEIFTAIDADDDTCVSTIEEHLNQWGRDCLRVRNQAKLYLQVAAGTADTGGCPSSEKELRNIMFPFAEAYVRDPRFFNKLIAEVTRNEMEK